MQDTRREVRAFEVAYLRYAPLLQMIAVRRFGIGAGDAEELVQAVFVTYFQHAAEVENLERYLIGAICNASRRYLGRSTGSGVTFCSEEPCAATPDEALLNEWRTSIRDDQTE